MLTFLSQSFRRLLNRAPAAGAPSLSPAPRLRLVSDSAARDIPIAPPPAAAAFVAGHGARIYSLDVFRRERPNPRRPRAA